MLRSWGAKLTAPPASRRIDGAHRGARSAQRGHEAASDRGGSEWSDLWTRGGRLALCALLGQVTDLLAHLQHEQGQFAKDFWLSGRVVAEADRPVFIAQVVAEHRSGAGP